jgi:heptosyltransferase III
MPPLTKTPKRILIINPFGIGDVLFSTPLVRALRVAYPQSRLVYLCNRRKEGILMRNPHLDDLIVFEKDEFLGAWKLAPWRGIRMLLRLIGRARRERFDLVIDLSLGDRYAFFLRWLGTPLRIGFQYRKRGRYLTHRLPISGFEGKHVVEHYRDLLQFIGLDLDDGGLELQLTERDQQHATESWKMLGLDTDRPVIAVVPAGGVSWGIDAPFRRWPLDRFAQVAQQLATEHNGQVVLFGEASDHEICDELLRMMEYPGQNLCGRTSLSEFVSLVACCDVLLTNDGGALHMAVSQDVPTVAIYGPVDPDVYGPYPKSPRYRVVTRSLTCQPCYHYFRMPACPYNRTCLKDLAVDTVLAAAKDVMAATAGVA